MPAGYNSRGAIHRELTFFERNRMGVRSSNPENNNRILGLESRLRLTIDKLNETDIMSRRRVLLDEIKSINDEINALKTRVMHVYLCRPDGFRVNLDTNKELIMVPSKDYFIEYI